MLAGDQSLFNFQNQQHTFGHKWIFGIFLQKSDFHITFQLFWYPASSRTKRSIKKGLLSSFSCQCDLQKKWWNDPYACALGTMNMFLDSSIKIAIVSRKVDFWLFQK